MGFESWLRIYSKPIEKHPSGAKAPAVSAPFMARLKPCPFKAGLMQPAKTGFMQLVFGKSAEKNGELLPSCKSLLVLRLI
jgi:hypothetical protein